jgi:hypothetical protein
MLFITRAQLIRAAAAAELVAELVQAALVAVV